MMKPTPPSLKPGGNRIKPAFHRNALQHQTDCRASVPDATALKPKRDKAAALIIVLAFVVLLTGLAVAFLSRGANNRQVAQSSFHDTDATLLARSALDIVVSDFKSELINGSTLSFGRYAPVTDGTIVDGSLVYAAILPQRD